jgi:prepilin-type N-terminal cleavage/methylation domain-containing protein
MALKIKSGGVGGSDFRAFTPNSELLTSNSKGFSLIEIIITLVVLSIAVVGVLSVFTMGSKGSADPLILNQAVSLAQEKVDEAIGLKKSGGYAVVVTNPGGAFAVPYAAFTWAQTVTCVDPDLVTPAACTVGYKIVTVTVTHAVIGSVSLDALVTDY